MLIVLLYNPTLNEFFILSYCILSYPVGITTRFTQPVKLINTRNNAYVLFRVLRPRECSWDLLHKIKCPEVIFHRVYDFNTLGTSLNIRSVTHTFVCLSSPDPFKH